MGTGKLLAFAAHSANVDWVLEHLLDLELGE
jgi:hypothetical protein